MKKLYVGFNRRLLAYLIDWILFVSFFELLNGYILKITNNEMILMNLLFFIYLSVLPSTRLQGTLGKYIMKIKIMNNRGERLSLSQSIGRGLAQQLSGLILFIGYFIIITDAKKQALHDKLANTYVVYH